MGKHRRTAPPRVRVAFATGMVALATVGSTGVANAEGPDLVDGTPCTEQARACVDLEGHRAWLLDGHGKVEHGPVPITSGKPGQETPHGDFRVQWKDRNHRSAEFDNAPMPNAVFFAPGGIAFHSGSLRASSAGCVHLANNESAAFYDFLSVGDAVQVR